MPTSAVECKKTGVLQLSGTAAAASNGRRTQAQRVYDSERQSVVTDATAAGNCSFDRHKQAPSPFKRYHIMA
jgi:hypothetical protein